MNIVPKVTVTVPVYNTSKYLRQCLDSLSAQTLKEIEFIVVDDGSTDDSGKICDEYANNDPRFKVIHQSNGGLASARQTGLDAANGEYIIPCDSDDWVEPDMYEKLYNKAKEGSYDIVCCGYITEYDNGTSTRIYREFYGNDKKDLLINILQVGYHMSWNKLIKRSLFNNPKIAYEPGINMGEDGHMLQKLIFYNNDMPQIGYVYSHMYHYRRIMNGVSYTNNVKMTHINQMVKVQKWRLDNLQDKCYSKAIFDKNINIAFSCLRAVDFDIKFYKNFLHDNFKWKQFQGNRMSLKVAVIILTKILPINATRKILKKIYPLVYK